MVHKHVAALALAHGAVVMAADLPIHALANINIFATGTDSGLEACNTAFDTLDHCFGEVENFTDLPEATQAACLCCDDSSALEPVYENCASYIQDNYPASSTEYSLNEAAATFCAQAEGATCTSGGLGSATPTTTSGGDDSPPPAACTSAVEIVSSCSEKERGFVTMADEDIASCVCYTSSRASSSFTTAFDDYIGSCATWAKTADPSDYSAFHALEGFCGDNTPRTTDAGTTTAMSTTEPPTTATGAQTSAQETTTVFVGPEPTGNFGARTMASEPLVWTASVLSLVLSFAFFA